MLGRYALAFALGVLATLAGFGVGHMMREHNHSSSALHTLLHHDFDLDADQVRKLDALEAQSHQRREKLEADLAAANADLARAIEREHAYGPAVAQAVDRSHHAMGALQKATLAHVFAMRQLLHPDQVERFDAAVNKALNQPTAD